MSESCGIHALVDKNFETSSFLEVLKRLDELNCILYEGYFEKIITVEEALLSLISQKNDWHGIVIKFEDTIVSLYFLNQDAKLLIGLAPLSKVWKKKESIGNNIYTDLARYMKFLLKICLSLEILELDAYSE